MHSLVTGAVLAALAALPSVSAHGYVQSIVAGGKTYTGANPNWLYAGSKPQTPGWFAYNLDNGFVEPSQYGNGSQIACHKGATPGTTNVVVAAGQTVTLNWNTWPDSHHGPVIDYLAKCSSSACAGTSAASLSFTKINAGGLVDGNTPPGTWASDSIVKSSTFAWTLTIPSKLAPGYYVLRHEIIALHAAGSQNGAQNYPQCVNLQVTGSGSVGLPGGTAASGLYKASDPGITISIYNKLNSYSIPGPALWTAAKRALDFTA